MPQPVQLPPGEKCRLEDYDPGYQEGLDKETAEAETRQHCAKLDELAYRLFAESQRALVVVLQGIDTSGKDGTIRMLASGVSPQCLDVESFKAPSSLLTTSSGACTPRCRPMGGSASSTAPTTRTWSWCGCGDWYRRRCGRSGMQ